MSQAISVYHGEFGRAALYTVDSAFVQHAHREGHLVFQIEGATSIATIDGSEYPVNQDFAVAVSPWEPHGFSAPESGDWLSLVLYIKPIWFLEISKTADFALQFGSRSVSVTHEISSLVRQICTFLMSYGAQDSLNMLLFDLCHVCHKQSWHNARSDKVQLARRSQLRVNDFRVRRALLMMQDKNFFNVHIGSLAREAGLSRPHFFKLFRQHLGVTPNVYLNTLRSERAIEYLVGSDLSVTDIGEELGFSSQASFTRFFSSNVGIAPSEYRRVACSLDASFPMMG